MTPRPVRLQRQATRYQLQSAGLLADRNEAHKESYKQFEKTRFGVNMVPGKRLSQQQQDRRQHNRCSNHVSTHISFSLITARGCRRPAPDMAGRVPFRWIAGTNHNQSAKGNGCRAPCLATGTNRHPQTDSMTPSTLASANTSIFSVPEDRCSGSRAQYSPCLR